MGNPFLSRWRVAVVLLAVGVATVASCAMPTQKPPLSDPFFSEDARADHVTGDLDQDEQQWRNEIAHEHVGDPDALLTDDPPKKPDEYGNVAFQDEPKKTFWENAGNASFAAATVMVTLGMMVAPYFLF